MHNHAVFLRQHAGHEPAVQAHGGHEVQVQGALPVPLLESAEASGWCTRTARHVDEEIDATQLREDAGRCGVAAFLASSRAAAITGTEFVIDGGTVPVA